PAGRVGDRAPPQRRAAGARHRRPRRGRAGGRAGRPRLRTRALRGRPGCAERRSYPLQRGEDRRSTPARRGGALVIVLNGEPRERDGATIVELLADLGVEERARGVAVAVNGEIVPRAEWPS